jgi:hypothetical protein
MGSGRDVRLVGGKFSRLVSKHTITGLTAATAYYFRLLPKTTAYGGTTSGLFRQPRRTTTISSFTTSLIKPTSVVVGWAGTDYSVVDVKWG